MASTNFIDKTTVVPTAWLNEVNGTVWTLFNAASTPSAGRTALGLGTMATQNANSVAITGGTLSGITVNGTFTTTSSLGGDFVRFNNTATGAEAAVRIDTDKSTSGVGIKFSNSLLDAQASIRGTSTRGLTFYTNQTAGASTTSGVQAMGIDVDGQVVIGTTPRVAGGRDVTVINTNSSASSFARIRTQSDAGPCYLQTASIAGGRVSSLYTLTGGSLDIFTQDSQPLRLGTANNASRLVIDSSGAVNAGLYLSENNTRVFSRNSMFQSPTRTVSSGNTTLTEPHGFSGVPPLVKVALKCVTAEYGYSVDEEIDMTAYFVSGNGFSISATSSNVILVYGANINIINKLSIPNLATITYANWRWVIRAWY